MWHLLSFETDEFGCFYLKQSWFSWCFLCEKCPAENWKKNMTRLQRSFLAALILMQIDFESKFLKLFHAIRISFLLPSNYSREHSIDSICLRFFLSSFLYNDSTLILHFCSSQGDFFLLMFVFCRFFCVRFPSTKLDFLSSLTHTWSLLALSQSHIITHIITHIKTSHCHFASSLHIIITSHHHTSHHHFTSSLHIITSHHHFTSSLHIISSHHHHFKSSLLFYSRNSLSR